MGSNIETFLHPPPGRVIQVHSRLRSLLETVTKEMEEAFPTGMASSQRDELLRTEAVYSAAIEDETDPNRVSLHHRALAGFLEQPLGERSLLDLHRGMMEGQPHAAPGMYRSIQVTIGQHRPPSPALIPSLMRELWTSCWRVRTTGRGGSHGPCGPTWSTRPSIPSRTATAEPAGP